MMIAAALFSSRSIYPNSHKIVLDICVLFFILSFSFSGKSDISYMYELAINIIVRALLFFSQKLNQYHKKLFCLSHSGSRTFVFCDSTFCSDCIKPLPLTLNTITNLRLYNPKKAEHYIYKRERKGMKNEKIALYS